MKLAAQRTWILWLVLIAAIGLAALIHFLAHWYGAKGNALIQEYLTYLATVGALVYAAYLWLNWVIVRRSPGVIRCAVAGAIATLLAQAALTLELFATADSVLDVIWAHSLVWAPLISVFVGTVAALLAWAGIWFFRHIHLWES